MKLELLVLTGPDAGRRLGLGPAAMVLGRSPEATLAFPHDTFLSSAHLQLLPLANGSALQIRDLGSTNGSFLNDRRIEAVLAGPGDILKAGAQSFRIVPVVAPSLEGDPVLSELASSEAPAHSSSVEDLVARLTATDARLYGVVDAAADPAILPLLQEAGHTMQSLYEGSGAQELAAWAPYLVALPANSPLLRTLLDRGWGKAWGCYCHSYASFHELRRHLRRFLMVQLEEGTQVYFRFYDPRVLREFLPTATFAEVLHFFGPSAEWLFEAADPQNLLRYRCTSAGLVTEALSLQLPAR